MKDINELFEIADNNLTKAKAKSQNGTVKFYKEIESLVETILTTMKCKSGEYNWDTNSKIIPKSGGEFETCKYKYTDDGLKIVIDYSWEWCYLDNPCGLIGPRGFDRNDKINFEKVAELLEADGIIITRKKSCKKTSYNYGTEEHTDQIIIDVPKEKGKGQYKNTKKLS